MPQPYKFLTLCSPLALLDVNVHTPATNAQIVPAGVSQYAIVTVKMRNTCDQIVRVQVWGNLGDPAGGVSEAAAAINGADSLGPAVDVQALTGTQMRIFSIYTDSKPPLIYVTVQALVLPTLGTILVLAETTGILPGMSPGT